MEIEIQEWLFDAHQASGAISFRNILAHGYDHIDDEINLRPVVDLTHEGNSKIIIPIHLCSRSQVTHPGR